MKGTDVTDAQLIHAGQFLQRAKDPSTQTWRGDAVTIHIPDLVRLLAWYGAIRARSGRNSPAPLIQRCTCANPGVDLMTTVCDCVTPTTTRCDCHATEHEFHDPRPEGEPNTKSLYDIPSGCICLGDGLMGMECTATEHARLRDERPVGSTGYPDYESTDPDERSDIGDSCVMGSAPAQYVCDCNAPGERKCEHGYCDSKDCRCLCHDKSLHEPPDTKPGPGDCMNFGTPEQLADMSEPQLVGKIVLAAKDLSPEALDSGATAESVSGLPLLHFPLEEPPNSVSDEPEINCGTFTDQPISRAATIRRQYAKICTLRERVNNLLAELDAAHKANDELEKEIADSRKAFLASTAIQAAEVDAARKANEEWAEQDREHARQSLNIMAQRDLAQDRLAAMCEHRWQCYGLKRDDGVTKWYVRDRNNRITDGWDTPEQAIDWAIASLRVTGGVQPWRKVMRSDYLAVEGCQGCASSAGRSACPVHNYTRLRPDGVVVFNHSGKRKYCEDCGFKMEPGDSHLCPEKGKS